MNRTGLVGIASALAGIGLYAAIMFAVDVDAVDKSVGGPTKSTEVACLSADCQAGSPVATLPPTIAAPTEGPEDIEFMPETGTGSSL